MFAQRLSTVSHTVTNFSKSVQLAVGVDVVDVGVAKYIEFEPTTANGSQLY